MILNHLVIFTELGWSWDTTICTSAGLGPNSKPTDQVPYLFFGMVPPQVPEGHSSWGRSGVRPGRGMIGSWEKEGKH